jgi:competence protein ComEC
VPTAGQVQLAVGGGLAPAQIAQWRAGRGVQVTAAVRRPTQYRNRGAPDAAHELVRRRVALTGTVKSALLVERVTPGHWIAERAAAVRARARTAIHRAAGADRQAAAIGIAVLIGDRAGLDPGLTTRLQRAGTFHVIAISGGNIALLSVLTAWTVGWIVGRGRFGLAVTAAVLIVYAVIVGGGSSVLRATGMAVVGLAARLLDQRAVALNVLAATGAALLVVDPLLAVDTGFWLTTAATAGLIVGLGDDDRRQPWWRRLVRSLVLASVWAELALLPIVALGFEQVTLAGVVLSAVAIPGMALAQVAAAAAVAADLWMPWLLPAAGVALRTGAALVTESARLVEWLPFLSWRVPAPAPAMVVLYYAALGAWLWARVPHAGAGAARLRPATRAAFVGLALWIAVAPATLVAWPRPHLDVTVFDVGQGDAIVVRFPDGRTMLVDAGGRPSGSFDIGARVVGPALRARGIRRLDYLVVTHADVDHIGGAASVIAEFAPAEVWTGVPVAGDAATAGLRAAADAVGAAWRTVQRGDRVAIGGVDVSVLHPPPPDWERPHVRNDDSVVLAVALGGVRAVLSGDISSAVEGEVAAAADSAWARREAPPSFTLLKVAHHGSAGSTSAAFLATLRPDAAVVSAGADAPFGHPAPPVLARLDEARVDLWRTDRDGEVTLRTDGRAATLSAFSGRTRRWPPSLP